MKYGGNFNKRHLAPGPVYRGIGSRRNGMYGGGRERGRAFAGTAGGEGLEDGGVGTGF